jgi:uncharacterized protein YjdB
MKQPRLNPRARRAILIAATALGSCARDATAPDGSPVHAVVLEPASGSVAIGASIDMIATVLDAAGSTMERPVHWAVEDASVLSVSASGTVTGQALGSTQVSASAGGRSAVAQISVVPVAVASVEIAPDHLTLVIGQTGQLRATTRDASGAVLTGRPVAWSSNNSGVASVSTTGLVTARAPGGAIITARSEGKTALASVTVSLLPVRDVIVKPASHRLIVGQTTQLQAEPVDSSGQPLPGRTIAWATSDAGTATVTSTGMVRAVAPGTALIIATCEGISDSATIDVTGRPPNAVVVSPDPAVVVAGSTVQLTATALDQQGAEIPGRTFTFASSDPKVATVSSTGLVSSGAQRVRWPDDRVVRLRVTVTNSEF